MIVCQQLFDQLNHLGNMACGPRYDIGSLASECIGIFPKGGDVFRCVVVDAKTGFLRLGDNAVLDIRDVHHVSNLVTFKLEITAQDVSGDGRTKVADVSVVPDGWPAVVKTHFALMQRLKLLELAGKRIVKLKHKKISNFGFSFKKLETWSAA